jgi:two-component system chemotaxis response regulator CheV
MTTRHKHEILLEAGTNEMEIIEFYLGSQPFGINVQKLKEIIPFDKEAVTRIPGCSAAMLGTLLLRGNTIPLIDLKEQLTQKGRAAAADQRHVVLICEFNNRINGFKVDGVNQIHRISWSDVQPMASFIDQFRPRFTGSVNIDGREVLIVDLEHIVTEFDPEANMDYEIELCQGLLQQKLPQIRKQMKLMMAEDSSLIRAGIEGVLKSAGYTSLEVFADGQACHDRLLHIRQEVDYGSKLQDHLQLLITDIEMPKMDGLTLCKKIKNDPVLKELKVILFSSLINEQMSAKCHLVGADGYATKPQIPYLVEMIDRMVGISK